ncbi:DUF1643 domain-containing protein [Lysinibacillus sphaericus]|uniref:DUF1643 domain-containing protein n=1 Tax=Lysinibacillus sphaericus TaxID=1421 RepID=UPI00055F38A4|nr:DUF1643 domain-containing protein [Lysinibacillus sphaericus]
MLLNNIYESMKHKLTLDEGKDDNGIWGRAIFFKNSSINKRYFLEKRWSDGDKILVALMMNPSNATEKTSDATVDQLISQAKLQKYNALFVINLSAKVEGNSSKLRMPDFDDDLNWSFIEAACNESKGDIFIGWGMKGQKGLKRQLKQNKIKSTKYNILSQFKKRYVCYELKASTSKNKYDPKYFVSHPRPRHNKNMYLGQPFKPLIEFDKVFVQPK